MEIQNLSIRGRDENWRAELRKNLPNRERTILERVPMPELDPNLRNKTNDEVSAGYTIDMAIEEAKRCLDCANPTCMNGCPVQINIPSFIKHIEKSDFLGAAKILKTTNTLPSVCGRVCQQEIQCEAQCIYTLKFKKPPVAIGNLERFAADFELASGKISKPAIAPANGHKIAVIGSGPAGLAAAGDLVKYGCNVTVFEALHEIGGVLKYGIPEFRLPNSLVDKEIENLKNMGVQFETNFVVGNTATIEDLQDEGFEAFFIGSGAGLPNFMGIPGENYAGIVSANEYLTRINLMGAGKTNFDTPSNSGKHVAIIGGGNTGIDAVRTAKRLGAERAMLIYRRSMDEIPARLEEIHHALDEGIEFICLSTPISYQADERGRVRSMIIQKMELGEPDSSGRRKPIPIPNSEYELAIDTVVVSVGVSPNPLIPRSIAGLEMNKWGTIAVNLETMQTSIPHIFAGGDIVRGGATVILAMGDGRKAAKGILDYVTKKN